MIWLSGMQSEVFSSLADSVVLSSLPHYNPLFMSLSVEDLDVLVQSW